MCRQHREHAPSTRGTPPRPRRRRTAACLRRHHINGISSTGTGGPRARCSLRDAAPCLQLKQADLPPFLYTQRARARSRHARTAPGQQCCQHARHRENRCSLRAGCARTAAASAAATGQQRAHTRRTAHRAHRGRPPRAAASSSAADTTHERRRTTTKICCCGVPKRTQTQSRRRRSMGYGNTGPQPRQRGGRLVPLMRAWLTPPYGRHHKAPPQPTVTAHHLRRR